MITYKLVNNRFGNLDSIQRSDGWSIPIAPDNTDYQAYLKHIAEGGEVLPADNEQTA